MDNKRESATETNVDESIQESSNDQSKTEKDASSFASELQSLSILCDNFNRKFEEFKLSMKFPTGWRSSKEEQEMLNTIKTETGIETDMYVDSIEDKLSIEEREKQYSKFLRQSTVGSLTKNFPGSKFLKSWDYLSLDQNEDLQQIKKSIGLDNLLSQFWIEISMPQNVCNILVNNLYHGLLHSFVRHWDQWIIHAPRLNSVWLSLGKIKDLITNIQRAGNQSLVEIEIKKLETELSQDKILRSLFLEAQLWIYKFMKKYFTLDNFAGIGVNGARQIQVYFKGDEKIIVACLAKNVFNGENCLISKRTKVCHVTTVFFMEKEKLKDLLVGKFKFEFG